MIMDVKILLKKGRLWVIVVIRLWFNFVNIKIFKNMILIVIYKLRKILFFDDNWIGFELMNYLWKKGKIGYYKIRYEKW